MWRAISWRGGSSAVFFVVAVATLAAAVAGPTYLAAADQSVLQAQLASQTPPALGYTIAAAPGVASPSVAKLEVLASAIPGGSGPGRLYGSPLITSVVSGRLNDRLTETVDPIAFLARSGVCQQVSFAAGTCPTGPGEVTLSTRTADALGVRVGSKITPLFRQGTVPPLTVSGLYVAPAALSSYWWGSNPFAFGASAGGASEFLDDGFLDNSAVGALAQNIPFTNIAQLPLNSSLVSATTVPAMVAKLAGFSSQLASQGYAGSTKIGDTFGVIEAEEQQMRGVIAVISLELVAIALVVLYGVASTMSEERRTDIAIAELRGFKRRSIMWIAMREPATLLAAAAPLGLLVGWEAVRLVSGHTFVERTPVTIDSLAVGTGLLAFVAGLGACAMTMRSLVSRSRRTALTTPTARRRNRSLVFADGIALVLTAVALIDLLISKGSSNDLSASGAVGSGGTASNPFAALAPALLGVAGGILAARVLPVLAVAAARATRWSPRLASSLAARGLMRQPGLARRALVPAIAVCVLVFAVSAFAVARANRRTQALFSTGAPVVLNVRVAPGVDPVAAVRAADPGGQQAMAAAVVRAPGGLVLAVDSKRFAKVGDWSGVSATSAAQVAQDLSPPVVEPLSFSKVGAMRLAITETIPTSPPSILHASVYDEVRQTEDIVDFGSLRPGTHEYTASVGGCAVICRLDSLTVFWLPSVNSAQSSANLSFTISAMQTQDAPTGWATVTAGLNAGDSWQGSDHTVSVVASSRGLTADFQLSVSATPPSVIRADAPALLPAVVTDSLASSNVNLATQSQFPAVGLDGSSITVLSETSAVALPEIGQYGALLDLSLLERVDQGSTMATQFQVWCRNAPSASLLAGLHKQGVDVTSASTASAAAGVLDRSGPALAFDLFLFGAVAAALLSLGSLIFAIAAGSRKRAVALAALAASGVPRKTLRKSLAAEYVSVVIVGVVLGFVAGVVTIDLALSSLPEFLPGRVGPALSVFVPWRWVLIAAGADTVVLLISALVSARLVMRRVTPECLRLSL